MKLSLINFVAIVSGVFLVPCKNQFTFPPMQLEPDPRPDYDPLKRYPSAERVLNQLIPTCSLYFFGDAYGTRVFRRFLDICIQLPVVNPFQYCIVITSSSAIALKYTSSIFSASTSHLTHRVGRISEARKHSEQCLVLLPYMSEFHAFKAVRLTKISRGRVNAKFVFVATQDHPLEKNIFATRHDFTNNYFFSGNSILFVVPETEPEGLFMFCQTCTQDTNFELPEIENSTTNALPMLGPSTNFSPTVTTTIDIGKAICLSHFKNTDQEALTISRIISLWTKLHKNLQVFSLESSKSTKEGRNQKRIARICGKIGRPMYEYVGGKDTESTLHRVADPQEYCMYKTIFTRHNFTGYSTQYPKRTKFRVPILPKLTYQETENMPVPPAYQVAQFWEKGPYILSQGAVKQGYKFTMFLDKKLVKKEVDFFALFRPLDMIVWLIVLLLVGALLLILQMTNKNVQKLHLLAIFLEQDINVSKTWTSAGLYLLLAVWMLGSFQLRLAYTANMYSYLAVESHPEIDLDLHEMVSQSEANGQYKLFTSHTDDNHLIAALNNMVAAEKCKNGSEYIYYFRLSRSVRPLFEEGIQELLPNGTTPEMHEHNTQFNNFYRFIPLKSLTHRFTLISHSNPSMKLYETWSGNKPVVDSDWTVEKHFEAMFIASERFIWKKGIWEKWGGMKWLNPRLRILHGDQFFFTNFFAKELDGLIQSGILHKWTCQMKAISKREYLMKILKLSYGLAGKTATLTASSSKDVDKARVLLQFEQVANSSLILIWSWYFVGMLLSAVFYLREIVRFEIPGHPNRGKARYIQTQAKL